MKTAGLDKIELLVLDVDGVLTDGTITINADGSESKSFDCLDGHGIKMWMRVGFEVAIISGRKSAPTVHRASQLGIEAKYIFEDCKDKLKALEELCERSGYKPEQIAYIGDDLMDICIMRRVGFAAAVANASDEIKAYADYVSEKAGGSGAVREVIEYILKQNGKWRQLLKGYRNA